MKDKETIEAKLNELVSKHKEKNEKATVPDDTEFPYLNDVMYEDDSLSRGIRILKWILDKNHYNNERN